METELSPVMSPTILTLFGVTGDLSARLVIPALFDLFQKNLLPENLSVLGFARSEWTDGDLQSHVIDSIKINRKWVDESLAETFSQHFSYVIGNANEVDTFIALKKKIVAIEDSWGICSNKLFYFSVSPSLFKNIAQNLAAVGLNIPCSTVTGWTRLLIEKPFGSNLQTAKELDSFLLKSYKEEQIFRIDHYLDKEVNQNIIAFRFSNSIFEPSWDNKHIESIHIRLLESAGVENRGAFFDSVGALRDVGANHLLQVLSLLTMDRPESLQAHDLRNKRMELFKHISVLSEEEIVQFTKRGQYVGFRDIDGVAHDSQTETYFKLQLNLKDRRWENIPIIIEAGKRMGTARKGAVVTYKHPDPCLCPVEMGHLKNRVTFSLSEPEGISISFMAKPPSLKYTLTDELFSFNIHDVYDEKLHINEYEQVLLDCFTGDQSRFVSTGEIESMWKIIDPIIDAWNNDVVPLHLYNPDSDEILNEG
ncbi:glucose-6-phosphate dehydrogenase [candidate division WWE3 bacterium]|uniref:Glucose-6-phosphate 1-dehydrogenase n=1 Tax=candidate division WWE3 bacterium TaxID=2053526 RepID=A0A955LGX5_UNCKA|nr:glucose-6-phosphate dehydrogenase [candidate division WWE3 bacterium]